jgi:hypothetical protein
MILEIVWALSLYKYFAQLKLLLGVVAMFMFLSDTAVWWNCCTFCTPVTLLMIQFLILKYSFPLCAVCVGDWCIFNIKDKVVPVIKHYAMKAYGGVDVLIHIFLTSALAGGEWSASRPCHFIPEEDPRTHWIGGWVDPRAGLDDVKTWKLLPPPSTELRSLGRAARSQSLYRLPCICNVQ